MSFAYASRARKLCMDDELFETCNIYRALKSSALMKGIEEWLTSYKDAVIGLGYQCYYCAKTFHEHRDRDSHVQLIHSHVCKICNAHFASEDWVTTHVQEHHDALFQLLLARGQTSYKCILADCTAVFRTSKARRMHLLRHHKMPLALAHGIVTSKPPTSRIRGDGSRKAPLQKPSPKIRSKACKFFTTEGGCKHGSSCRFTHIVNTDQMQLDESDDLVSEIVGKMSSMQIKVPTSITFGRRRM